MGDDADNTDNLWTIQSHVPAGATFQIGNEGSRWGPGYYSDTKVRLDDESSRRARVDGLACAHVLNLLNAAEGVDVPDGVREFLEATIIKGALLQAAKERNG